MELFPRACVSETARNLLLKSSAHRLFPDARDPDSSLGGLFLYFSCLKEAHDIVGESNSIDCAYWHAMMHRMEGDGFNAGYWFRRVGPHPIFTALHREASQMGYAPDRAWDPFGFIRFCESASGTKDEGLARRVQLAEWQVMFDYCAAPIRAAADRHSQSHSQSRVAAS
jgi:hypothetical protein